MRNDERELGGSVEGKNEIDGEAEYSNKTLESKNVI